MDEDVAIIEVIAQGPLLIEGPDDKHPYATADIINASRAYATDVRLYEDHAVQDPDLPADKRRDMGNALDFGWNEEDNTARALLQMHKRTEQSRAWINRAKTDPDSVALSLGLAQECDGIKGTPSFRRLGARIVEISMCDEPEVAGSVLVGFLESARGIVPYDGGAPAVISHEGVLVTGASRRKPDFSVRLGGGMRVRTIEMTAASKTGASEIKPDAGAQVLSTNMSDASQNTGLSTALGGLALGQPPAGGQPPANSLAPAGGQPPVGGQPPANNLAPATGQPPAGGQQLQTGQPPAGGQALAGPTQQALVADALQYGKLFADAITPGIRSAIAEELKTLAASGDQQKLALVENRLRAIEASAASSESLRAEVATLSKTLNDIGAQQSAAKSSAASAEEQAKQAAMDWQAKFQAAEAARVAAEAERTAKEQAWAAEKKVFEDEKTLGELTRQYGDKFVAAKSWLDTAAGTDQELLAIRDSFDKMMQEGGKPLLDEAVRGPMLQSLSWVSRLMAHTQPQQQSWAGVQPMSVETTAASAGKRGTAAGQAFDSWYGDSAAKVTQLAAEKKPRVLAPPAWGAPTPNQTRVEMTAAHVRPSFRAALSMAATYDSLARVPTKHGWVDESAHERHSRAMLDKGFIVLPNTPSAVELTAASKDRTGIEFESAFDKDVLAYLGRTRMGNVEMMVGDEDRITARKYGHGMPITFGTTGNNFELTGASKKSFRAVGNPHLVH